MENVPEAERRELWDEAFSHSKSQRQTRLVWPLIVVVFAVALTLGDWFFASRFNPGWPRIVPMVILGGVGGFGFAAVLWIVQRHLMQRYLWQRLPHLCNQCGYDLTGNTSGRCPECGQSMQPTSR